MNVNRPPTGPGPVLDLSPRGVCHFHAEGMSSGTRPEVPVLIPQKGIRLDLSGSAVGAGGSRGGPRVRTRSEKYEKSDTQGKGLP
jgi:hypothetical protein